jgi:DNA-binding transcriptional MerR regulator
VNTRESLNDEHLVQFADGKAPDALRTIGEVAKALGIRQHVLRYWEEQFPMLRPVKRSGGRRYYRPEDVRLVATIDRLVHREGFTLRGARQTLSRGASASTEVGLEETQVIEPLPYEARSRLLAIRARLEAALRIA